MIERNSDNVNMVINKPFIVAIIINITFVILEVIIGITNNSMSLISDAGHTLSDSLGMILVLISFLLAKMESTKKFTYGYKKTTILISLINSIILIATVIIIIFESLQRMQLHGHINGQSMSYMGIIALCVNLITVYLLSKGQKNDVALRTIFIHKLADILVSIGLLVSGIIIMITGIGIIDRILSIIIAAIVLVPAIKLLITNIRLTIDGVPENIDIDDIKNIMMSIPGVEEVHHIHVWALSTQENALTAHVHITNIERTGTIIAQIRNELMSIGIQHVTIEAENKDFSCTEQVCHIPNH